jgi:proline iminopeptidase
VDDPRYPPIEPHAHGMLDVGDGHSVYWEVAGNPDGVPALWLHGGPGSGSAPGSRRLFDPQRYRIVLLDQRGCGRSTPSAAEPDADLSTNTTAHLVADLELLREHLGIERWLVTGGSWGVTLARAYAVGHLDRVSGMVLLAVTDGSHRREVDWITRDMGRVFPREWESFRDGVPPAERDGDLCAAYSRLLHDPDPAVAARAARDWCAWEDTHVSLADPEPRLTVADPAFQLTFARLVTHYWAHGCFLEEGLLLREAGRLAGTPGVLIHGRLDVSGPLDTAWHLHRAWPGSELVVVEDDGHGGPGMTAAFVAATDRLAQAPVATS